MEKLIRDKIPEMAAAKGDPVLWRTVVSPDERVALLRRKLSEELDELLGESDVSGIVAEAADLLEVIEAYVTASGSDMRAVLDEKTRKREARG